MKKLKVIKKIVKTPCWVCEGKGEIMVSASKTGATYEPCKICQGTGKWLDETYYHIYTGKEGKKYCIDGDSLK